MSRRCAEVLKQDDWPVSDNALHASGRVDEQLWHLDARPEQAPYRLRSHSGSGIRAIPMMARYSCGQYSVSARSPQRIAL